MKPCLSEDVLHAYLDGEVAAEDEPGLSAHIAECASCAARVREAEKVSRLIGAAIAEAIPQEVPTSRLYARIEAGLRSAPAPATPSFSIKLGELLWPFRRYSLGMSIAVLVATMLVLVVVSWRLGLLTREANSSDLATLPEAQNTGGARGGVAATPQEMADNRPASPPVANRSDQSREKDLGFDGGRRVAVATKRPSYRSDERDGNRYGHPTRGGGLNNYSEFLDTETARHVEEAQSLFHSIINIQVPSQKAALDFSREKRLSRRLLNNNTLLSRRAETQGDWLAEEMLSRLEPFLLDIANLPDKPSTDEVRLVKELVRGRLSPP